VGSTVIETRAVSAALHTQKWWTHAVKGAKIQSRHHIVTSLRKLRSLKLKYEALEISEVGGALWKKSAYALLLLWASLIARCLHITAAAGGPFQRKVAYLYITVAAESLWKQGRPTLHITVAIGGSFGSVVMLLTHYICYCDPLEAVLHKCSCSWAPL